MTDPRYTPPPNPTEPAWLLRMMRAAHDVGYGNGSAAASRAFRRQAGEEEVPTSVSLAESRAAALDVARMEREDELIERRLDRRAWLWGTSDRWHRGVVGVASVTAVGASFVFAVLTALVFYLLGLRV